jgi:hypothetical protein
VVNEAGEVEGLRELRSAAPDCRVLDEEIALVIALIIEPGAGLGAPPAPSPAPPRVSSAPPRPVAPVAATPAPAVPEPLLPPQPWRFDAGAGVAGGVGFLPGVGVAGIAVHAHFTPPHWPALEVGGALWLPREAGTSSGGGTFSMGWGSLAVCPLDLTLGASGLRLCLGGALGAIFASPTGLLPGARQEQTVFSPQATFQYRRRLLGPLFASAGLGLLVPTARPSFYFTDLRGQREDVFQAAPVAGTLELGLGVSFP